MESCKRKVCWYPVNKDYMHKTTGDFYCRKCAKMINAACQEEVISGLEESDWKGKNFREFVTPLS